LSYSKRTALIQHTLVLVVLTTAVFLTTGYILYVPEFHSSIYLFPAFQTCILFLLLTLAILLSQPEEGIIKFLIGDWEGSRIGRLLIPVTIAVPFLITQFRLFAEHSGWVSTEFGSASVLLSFIIILTVFLFTTISSLNIRDKAQSDFIIKINNLNAELKEGNDHQLASNEELLASNEEIKAANEELSAMNEQLALAAEAIRMRDQVIIDQKEEALKRSQQHLEIIFSNTKEEILLMDTEGRLVLFNNSLERFILKATGHKPRIGMYVWDMTAPSRREVSKKLFREALAGHAVTSEATLPTPDGEVIHLLKYEPVFVEGNVTYVTLISIDITEQRKQEAALKQSENNLKAIFDNTLDSFALLSPDSKIVAFNSAYFNNIFKTYGKEIKIGESLMNFIPPERRPTFMNFLEKVKAGERVEYHQEVSTFGAWFKVSIIPVHSKSGEFTGYCISASDETAIHKAQLELRHKEERFRGLVEHSKDIFLIIIGQTTTYVSSNINEVLGYDPQEFTQYELEDLVHADDLPIRWNELGAPGNHQMFEYRIRNKNGNWQWMEGFCVNLSDVESIGGLVFTSRDVTDRKIAEDKLRKQFEELEKTNYELDHFVYSVSHDLRAPLSSILGLINVAEMEKSEELPFLGMIKGRVNHLDGFIKDILDYSRNARTELESEIIDFSQLFEETKDNLKLVSGFERLTIKFNLNDQILFYSDSTRLGIILNNLVSNAIKFQNYLRPDPTISITITANEHKAEIIATDNGIGIGPEHMSKIFDMFYRATDKSKGSGLGLYIVKETVAKLHGTIKAKSKPGEFTTFEIVIPNS